MSMVRFLRLGFVTLVVFALAVGQAGAQATTGTIAGTVADEQGQVLPGANVTLVEEGTGYSRTGVTDKEGNFQFASLPPGSYTVRVGLSNFRPVERQRNVLSAADRLSVGVIKLAVGLGETVVVEASGAQVNTEDSQHSGLITAKQIEQIQVKGRDVTSLMRLVPGVRYEDTVESLGESFGTLVPHVGGQRRDWNTIMIDGALGNEIGQANRMAQQINLDAIGEVKVLLNTYRAEYGRTGGAQVQIVTKSGQAQYSGGAYYYGRHESLNANDFFNNRAGREKPRYRFNTFGAYLGGPIPGLNNGTDKKLFFFYSLEMPITEKPGNLLNWTMPTERERRGDFSQTLDSAGRLVVIRDPVTGQPFPGNIIPANRINPNGLALLNLMPLPNTLDRNFTQGQFNHQSQAINDNPKRNQILRVDWRPSPNDNLYFTVKEWWSDQRGVGGGGGVTAGPAGWGLTNAHYLNTDRGGTLNYTKIFRSNLINDASFGVRQQTEQFHPVTAADFDRIRRSNAGYRLGQFHPELNPEGVIPKATFTGVPSPPNITFDNRLIEKGTAWLYSFQDNLTYIKGSHTFKTGFYAERLNNSEGKGGVGGGPWAGEFSFNVDTANPFDARHPFANALLGSFRQYREVDAFPEVQARRSLLEGYLQDTWKASRRLTVDYGIRFLWYQPWYTEKPASTFVPERYDPAKAPRLYEPRRINGQNVGVDPVTGQVVPNVLVGSFVPGTGDPSNGMVRHDDPSYPRGFRDNQGIHPEPRIGFAYDLTNDGKTALHASAGIYHNAHITARSMDVAANNPPAVNTPDIFYGTMDTVFQTAAFSLRPGNVQSLERNAKTPTSYNWSLGVQRDIGWGTVVDLTYVGWTARNMEFEVNINPVPDGARFLDRNPQNRDPRNPNSPLPPEFLRPFRGYQNIIVRQHLGDSKYNALQVQLNRRYIRGLQFAVAYTLSKAEGLADEDERTISLERPLRAWHYGPAEHSQTHNLVFNYTWDLPKASKLADNRLVRLLFDNWQISGENAFVSGDWNPVLMTTTDNFDFTGGEGGTGGDVGDGLRIVRPNIVGDPVVRGNPAPGAEGGWLDPAAFARPNGRGDFGNSPRMVYQEPGVNNWNLSFFKNFPMGGNRRLQFRWEMYNVLNKTQFENINNTARFDAAGKQVNAAFGEATSTRKPRIMQGSIRFSF